MLHLCDVVSRFIGQRSFNLVLLGSNQGLVLNPPASSFRSVVKRFRPSTKVVLPLDELGWTKMILGWSWLLQWVRMW
jgi:hypothetical protein